jgi:hypothetical protein
MVAHKSVSHTYYADRIVVAGGHPVLQHPALPPKENDVQNVRRDGSRSSQQDDWKLRCSDVIPTQPQYICTER